MADAAPVLEFADVSLTREGVPLLSGISWRVERGQHWVALGANGSGKTLLLSLAAGQLWPSEGEVRLLGQRLGSVDLRLLRQAVGWVSATFRDRVPRRLSALGVVRGGFDASLGQPLPDDAERDARCGRCLELLGAGGLSERPFGVLSQGEQQRVLIARALVSEPDLLVLDEVCSGLDPAGRELVVSALERIAAEGQAPTLVLVTHHVEEIAEGFTHALTLSHGRVVAQGPLDEVLRDGVLARAFGTPVRVERRGRRWVLWVQ